MSERWIHLDGYIEEKGSVLICFGSSEEKMGLGLMGNAG